MNKQGYPRGNPAEDCQKLQLWWTEEMQKAGFSDAVAVEHLRLDPQQPPSLGFGKQLFESLVLQRQATMKHLRVWQEDAPAGFAAQGNTSYIS